MLRRLLVTTGATEMLAAAPVSAAFATSGAHFFKDTGATVADNGALAVTIDEAGDLWAHDASEDQALLDELVSDFRRALKPPLRVKQ